MEYLQRKYSLRRLTRHCKGNEKSFELVGCKGNEKSFELVGVVLVGEDYIYILLMSSLCAR